MTPCLQKVERKTSGGYRHPFGLILFTGVIRTQQEVQDCIPILNQMIFFDASIVDFGYQKPWGLNRRGREMLVNPNNHLIPF